MTVYIDSLRPASWRGLPFGVLSNETTHGRRKEIHEFPFRDGAWVEDLGLAPKRLSLVGFLVGDDAVDQKQAFIDAADQRGPGELVHPTLGTLEVELLHITTAERWDQGRVVELGLTFLEVTEAPWIIGTVATGSGVLSAASWLDRASAGDLVGGVQAAVQSSSGALRDAVSTVGGWAQTARGLVNSASASISAVGGIIPGAGRELSRFSRGMRRVTAPVASVQAALGRVSTARQSVTNTTNRLQSIAEGL